jgi:hypothetical protein
MKAMCQTEEMVIDTRSSRVLKDNYMVKKVMATTAENLFHLENTVEKLAKVVKAGTSSNSATTTSKTVAGGGKNRGKKRKRKSRTGYVKWDQEEEEEFADPDTY